MSIDVRGGAGGFGVGLDEVETAAGRLAALAREVTAAAGRVAAIATNPHLVASHLASPVTGARAELALARLCGPSGLAGQACALGALALAAGDAVSAYRAGELAVTTVTAGAEDAVMYAVGARAPWIAVGVLTLAALDPGVGGLLDRVVFRHPDVAELGGGTRGLVAGLASSPLTGPMVAAGALRQLVPGADPGDASGDVPAEAVRVLADAGDLVGLLRDEGWARVTAEPAPRPGARAPTGVADLALDCDNLGDADGYPAHVRVVEVPGAEGSAWVVEVAGTQVWDPHAGDNPFDVTSDVRLMARQSTVLAAGVEQALDEAQAATGRDTSGEPVMLAGHSLGGIVAAGLASSARFRGTHRVTHVVTLGSPVAGMPVPPSVQVLSLEHVQDPVPRLDGRSNPDRRGWVTVSRDLQGEAGGARTASGSHATAEYVVTGRAVDDSGDVSVARWRDGSRQFFEPAPGRSAVVRDFQIRRVDTSSAGDGASVMPDSS